MRAQVFVTFVVIFSLNTLVYYNYMGNKMSKINFNVKNDKVAHPLVYETRLVYLISATELAEALSHYMIERDEDDFVELKKKLVFVYSLLQNNLNDYDSEITKVVYKILENVDVGDDELIYAVLKTLEFFEKKRITNVFATTSKEVLEDEI